MPRRSGALVLVALWILAAPLSAQTPPTTPPAPTTPKPAAEPEPKDDLPPEDRWEPGGVPAINFDSDTGFGFGIIGTLTRFYGGLFPYNWRMELQLYWTVKFENGTEFPYQSHYIDFDMPGLLDNDLRLRVFAVYRQFSNYGYFGLGSNSEATTPWEAIDQDADPEGYTTARRFHQLDHIYPQLRVTGRYRLFGNTSRDPGGRLDAFGGLDFSFRDFNVYEGSKFQQDIELARTDAVLGDLLLGTDTHFLLQFPVGLLYDSRDHEFTPTSGIFAELGARISPGIQDDLAFFGFTASFSGYLDLLGDYLVLGTRILFDGLVGNAPFYELTTFGTFNPQTGPGGFISIRGIPQQRYFGKLKLFTNWEIRTMFLPFSIGSQRFNVGITALLDAGRVWADWTARQVSGRALDGDFGDFSVGAGGGLRIKWGETFLLRADYAQAITAENTSGVYLTLGNVF